MKRKRLFGLLLAVVMLFSIAPALGSTAEAEVITAVTATMTGDPNEICQLGKPIAYPSFSTSSGNTAEVVSESATWERNGSSVGSGVFTEGSWLLWVPVVVDGAAHPSDSLSDSVTLTVNGQPWVPTPKTRCFSSRTAAGTFQPLMSGSPSNRSLSFPVSAAERLPIPFISWAARTG